MSFITSTISGAATSLKDAVSSAATYVHDTILPSSTPAKPVRTYTHAVTHVNDLHKAGDEASDDIETAWKAAVAAIDGAAGIAHAAIKVSAGDSGVDGAQSIFEQSSQAAFKKFEASVQESKEKLDRAVSSANETCTEAEKTAVADAVKVALAKYESAAGNAKAQVEQAYNKCKESVMTSGANTLITQQAVDAATLGYRAAQTNFEHSANEALDIVKAATKLVRDAKTPGETVDAKLIVQNELVRAHQHLDNANLGAQRNREDITSLGQKGANEANCAMTKAKVEACDKEALAKQKATYVQYKAKLEEEAKTVA